MKLLTTDSIVSAIGKSTHGCVELDIFMFMLLHPHLTYEYTKGQYFVLNPLENRRKRKKMVRYTPAYTTDYVIAKQLLKPEWIYEIKTNNVCSQVSIVTRQIELVSCRAPTEALGICYCVGVIVGKEGYAAELKSENVFPVRQTYFHTEEDHIIAEREKIERRKDRHKALRQHQQRMYFAR